MTQVMLLVYYLNSLVMVLLQHLLLAKCGTTELLVLLTLVWVVAISRSKLVKKHLCTAKPLPQLQTPRFKLFITRVLWGLAELLPLPLRLQELQT